MQNILSPTTEAERQQAEVRQFREFLTSYNKLSEMCFMDCVHDFTVRKVHDREETCSVHCMEKYLKMTQRISQRFQEYQLIQNEAALASAQKS
ncbi:PREDICTED: mitochondrial import inner membrane translocase subunit Tim9-like [Priapulus caudatus]|uniref:Mitochondrial import inner membrane translocase subunit n=1 Tax=Priapulus caudatus TaxID=37621 RepID=A0ABM1E189_PRICU|nr:PREDICTED: mitochondrial import inner membrane translocase subunit Tim9-like [Priapulus caudatus]